MRYFRLLFVELDCMMCLRRGWQVTIYAMGQSAGLPFPPPLPALSVRFIKYGNLFCVRKFLTYFYSRKWCQFL